MNQTLLLPSAPHDWITCISALLVPVVGILAVCIAYRQWRTAQNKLKFDLFDRRMSVYQTACEMLAFVTTHGSITQQEEIKYVAGTRPARWLFSQEVFDYLDKTLRQKIIDLEYRESMTAANLSDQKRDMHLRAKKETIQWFRDQYEVLDEKCAEYLSLSH